MRNLDIGVLRTLIAIDQYGSFARAAERIGRSESAVSLQLKRLEEIIGRLGEVGFPLSANGLYASSIGCIGDPHCNYAVTPTKTKLATILKRLEAQFGNEVAGLKLNLDGCPHACAQHWTGDIGLQGTTGRGPKGEPLEAFDIILRGGLGVDAAIGKPLLRRVPSPQIEDHVARLFEGYLGRRLPEESFSKFCVRLPDADLIAIARGSSAEPAAESLHPADLPE